MPKSKEPELTPAEQFKRFMEGAKKAGVTDNEKEPGRAFEEIAPAKPPQTSKGQPIWKAALGALRRKSR
jgi:hypothetical protein